MIVSTDPDYLDTKLVKQGVKKLDPIFQDLAQWINQKFKTQVLNIYYDKIEVDKNRPRLNIIFEYRPSAEKFRDAIGNYDPIKQTLIAREFRQILQSNTSPNLGFFEKLFRKSAPTKFDTERLLVIFNAFEPVAREEANSKILQTEIDEVKNNLRLDKVWEIYRQFETTTYFFYTNKQIEDSKNNGRAAKMRDQYFELLKKYDEFDYIKHEADFLFFDSKENFENNFHGNWFYYSRR